MINNRQRDMTWVTSPF